MQEKIWHSHRTTLMKSLIIKKCFLAVPFNFSEILNVKTISRKKHPLISAPSIYTKRKEIMSNPRKHPFSSFFSLEKETLCKNWTKLYEIYAVITISILRFTLVKNDACKIYACGSIMNDRIAAIDILKKKCDASFYSQTISYIHHSRRTEWSNYEFK